MSTFDTLLVAVDAASAAAGNERRERDNASYDEWSELLNFVPPATVQQEVKARDSTWFFNQIQRANGVQVNCDFYGVLINALPSGFATAGALLEHVRLHLNDFFDHSITDFEAYDDAVDKPRWESATPLGAVMRFDINVFPWMGAFSNFEDGSVICTAYVPQVYWRFSTLSTTGGDFDHPVSGHREWGIQAHASGGHVLYTKATDRVTGNPTGMFAENPTFNGGHRLWVSFQEHLASFVNSSGSAVIQEPETNRPTWETIKDLYHPTSSWL